MHHQPPSCALTAVGGHAPEHRCEHFQLGSDPQAEPLNGALADEFLRLPNAAVTTAKNTIAGVRLARANDRPDSDGVRRTLVPARKTQRAGNVALMLCGALLIR